MRRIQIVDDHVYHVIYSDRVMQIQIVVHDDVILREMEMSVILTLTVMMVFFVTELSRVSDETVSCEHVLVSDEISVMSRRIPVNLIHYVLMVSGIMVSLILTVDETVKHVMTVINVMTSLTVCEGFVRLRVQPEQHEKHELSFDQKHISRRLGL